MPLQKAEKVIGNWKKNNFNATKALKESGYSISMATKQQNKPIASALKVLAKEQLKRLDKGESPRNILDVVNMSEGDVIGNYRMIIEQNKDLTNKLKALQPLLAQLGIKWSEETTKVTVPVLNISMETPSTETVAKDIGVIDVAQ